MQRLAWMFAVVAAGCGGSGVNTGMATLSAAMVKSASATPFTGADADGTMVLGWKIKFYPNAPGDDCTDDSLGEVATLAIFTNQPAGSAKVATIETGGEVVIVKDSPPSTMHGNAATMGIDAVSNVTGTLFIDDAYLDHINGTISAGGNDLGGAPISITGMFEAPACGS